MEKLYLAALLVPLVCGIAALPRVEAAPTEFRYKESFLRQLVAAVPDLLKAQDPQTGRFGKGIWIVNDQHAIYPLAAAWATPSAANPYYHDPKVLETIMAGGDALIADADAAGQWIFRKKDGSTWGKIYMPWTYSRWLRAFGLIREGMPPERRQKWEEALIRGYTGIAKQELGKVHNIPTHHAMGLYHAGQLFHRPEWCAQAQAFMAKVVETQDPSGFWSENHGPVVAYNFVYSDALGAYYAFSHDQKVRGALERAARFHANFTYPNGSLVETVDERNPYHASITMGNVGFAFTPEGRGFLAQELALLAKDNRKIDPDNLASFLLYGEEGAALPTAAGESDRTYVQQDRQALIRRKGPWYICLSAYHCPIPTSRWIQDRQNLVSIYHDRNGLILGGGNTKLQPLWSNFTVGDTSLLRHQPGETSPKFTPTGPLFHVPATAALKETDPPGLQLEYGGEQCGMEVEPVDEKNVRIHVRATARSGKPVQAHLTFLPHVGKSFQTARGPERKLGAEAFTLTAAEAGDWLAHAGWRLSLPAEAIVTWPVLPHNPYVKDGAAKAAEGRLVVSLPFSPERGEYTLTLTVE